MTSDKYNSNSILASGNIVNVIITNIEQMIEFTEQKSFNIIKQIFSTHMKQINCCHYFKKLIHLIQIMLFLFDFRNISLFYRSNRRFQMKNFDKGFSFPMLLLSKIFVYSKTQYIFSSSII